MSGEKDRSYNPSREVSGGAAISIGLSMFTIFDRYETRVEELRAKFPNEAKMRAEYEIYCKKRLALV